MSNLTMWNRTVELVSRTCNRTHTILLNVSTWHHTNQSAFNGSVTWLLNATKRMMYMNFTKLAYPLNATWYMISFSRNRYHFNSTVYRRNGIEVSQDSLLVTSLQFMLCVIRFRWSTTWQLLQPCVFLLGCLMFMLMMFLVLFFFLVRWTRLYLKSI